MFLVSCYQSDQVHTLWFGMYQQESRENIFHDCLVFQRREVTHFWNWQNLFIPAFSWLPLEIWKFCMMITSIVLYTFLTWKWHVLWKGNWSSVCELISLFFIAPLNLKERPLYLEFSCCGFYFILYKYINERGKILSIWVPHTVCEICLPSTIYVCKANVKLYLKSALSNSSMHKLYNVSIRPFLFSPAFNWKWTLLFPAPRGGLQTWLQPWKTQCSAEVVMCVFLAAIFSCSTC